MKEMNTEVSFLCRECGYRADAEEFGTAVRCPKCKSANIVHAGLWEQYTTGGKMQRTGEGSTRTLRDDRERNDQRVQPMNATKGWRARPRHLSAALLLMLLAAALYAFGQYYSSPEQRAAREYDYLVETHRLGDLYALEQVFHDTVNGILPIAPPSHDYFYQGAAPYVVPFDPEGFPKEFSAHLVGAWNEAGTAPSYIVEMALDKHNNLHFINEEGDTLYTLSAPPNFDPLWYYWSQSASLLAAGYTGRALEWWRGVYDMRRFTVTVELVPTDYLYDYLLAEAEAAESYAAPSGSGGGTMLMSMGSTNEILIAGMELTNNTIKLTFLSTYTNTSTWEVFTYDAGGKNPTFNGLVPVWELAATNIVLTNNVPETWTDTNIFAAVNRFYALGSADDDDGDGLSNGREVFTYKTDINVVDTDGDGMDDGDEAEQGFDPAVSNLPAQVTIQFPKNGTRLP